MIWLASFPRSGNTFFRNILFEVYGLKSSTFHQDADYFLDADYASFPFVKTHLLPSQLVPDNPDIKAVYIIRDGRDTMVSMAHHRKDIVVPGSDYYENLKAAIIAEKGSFFGGWSRNVLEWIRRADIVIRYEDLLIDPIGCAERLRAITNLPEPDALRIPEFNQLKQGIAEYGSGKGRGLDESQMLELSRKNFRKGKTGNWKEEMPEELQDLFWSYHGDVMDHLGYGREGNIEPLNADLDYEVIAKLGMPLQKPEKKIRILIEADKMIRNDNDGVKRYQAELLKQLAQVDRNPLSRWEFSLFAGGNIRPLAECGHWLHEDFRLSDSPNDTDGKAVRKKSLFQQAEFMLLNLIPDRFVQFLYRNNILVFHKAYEWIKKSVFGFIGFAVDLVRKILAFVAGILYKLRDDSKLNKLNAVFNQFDLIHLPLQQHYYPFRKVLRPVLVTIHDFTHRFFPEHHTSININNAEKGLRFIEERGWHVLTVSQSTLQDSMRELRLPGNKLHMVYEAADRQKFSFQVNREDTRKVKEKYGIPADTPFLLSLSTIEPRKNLENTIRAFMKLAATHQGLHLNLVIAGKKGWLTNTLFTQNKLFAERVHFTGFVDDRDLSALYTESLALTYMSYYEGFGLPPLEAMSCGTPVVYSNRSSLPEIIGDAGLAADPDDVDGIMERFELLYTRPDLRSTLSSRALKRSLDFSWRKAAIETLSVYEKIINSRNQEEIYPQ